MDTEITSSQIKVKSIDRSWNNFMYFVLKTRKSWKANKIESKKKKLAMKSTKWRFLFGEKKSRQTNEQKMKMSKWPWLFRRYHHHHRCNHNKSIRTSPIDEEIFAREKFQNPKTNTKEESYEKQTKLVTKNCWQKNMFVWK